MPRHMRATPTQTRFNNGMYLTLTTKLWGVLVPELRLLLSIGLVVVSVAILFFQEVFAE